MSILNSHAYRAALFDLDGTLWHSNPIHAAAFRYVCLKYGLKQLPYSTLAGLGTDAAFSLILTQTPLPCSIPMRRLVAEKQQAFRSHAHRIGGEEKTLIDFSYRNPHIMTALVTNASAFTASVFTSRLPDEFFGTVLSSADGFPGKPAPDPYQAAAQRLGVTASDCLVFEDSRAGLLSARAAGMAAIHILNESHSCEQPDIPHLACVRRLSEGLSAFPRVADRPLVEERR